MGLFAKLRSAQEAAAPEYAVWQPDGLGVGVEPASLLPAPDDCAATHAYSAGFELADAPGALITISSYETWGPDDIPGSFVITYCCEYGSRVGSGHEPWTSLSQSDD